MNSPFGKTILERVAALEVEVMNLKAAAAARWQAWLAIVLSLIALCVAWFTKAPK